MELTDKQRQFAIHRAYGKTQLRSYELAGYSVSTPQTMSVEASRIESTPQVKEYITQLQKEMDADSKKQFLWDREIATQRILSLVEQITLPKQAQIMLNCFIELNKIWRVCDTTTNDERIQIIFEDPSTMTPDNPNLEL